MSSSTDASPIHPLQALACTLAILLICHLARTVLQPLLIAGVVTLLAIPAVTALRRFGLSHGMAAAVCIFVSLTSLAALGFGVVGTFAIGEHSTENYTDRVFELNSAVQRWLGAVELPIDSIVPSTDVLRGALQSGASWLLSGFTGLLSNLLLVALLVGFALVEYPSLKRRLSALGAGNNSGRLTSVANEVQRYFLWKTLISAATGVLAGLTCWAWGIDFAIPLGVAAFLLNYVPFVGSAVAGIPAGLLALVEHGPVRMLAVGASYLMLNILVGNIIEPRIFGRTSHLSPLAVLLGIVILGYLLGPVGALIAVPILWILRAWAETSRDYRWIACLLSHHHDASETSPPPTELVRRSA